MRFKLDENLDPRLAPLVAALPALKRERLEGALWIVEPGRIRAHTPGGEDA